MKLNSLHFNVHKIDFDQKANEIEARFVYEAP